MVRNLLSILMMGLLAATSVMAEEAEPENLLENASFELAPADDLGTPAEWGWFSSGEFKMTAESSMAFDGEKSCRFESQEKPDSYMGIFQRCVVSPDKEYNYSVQVRRDKKAPLRGSVTGRLVIEWTDAGGKEIGRIYGAEWNRSLSGLRWTRIVMSKIKPPEGADTAVFGIHLTDNKPGGKGAFYVDDVRLVVE